jgi:hypothetical protein
MPLTFAGGARHGARQQKVAHGVRNCEKIADCPFVAALSERRRHYEGAKNVETPDPLPLGGEGGPLPALSPAGAGRVRGSGAALAMDLRRFAVHDFTPVIPATLLQGVERRALPARTTKLRPGWPRSQGGPHEGMKVIGRCRAAPNIQVRTLRGYGFVG